jgi:hypothetical protein
MERIIKNIGQTYMQSEVNRVYRDGKIEAIIIASKGFYSGNGHEAFYIGQREGLTLYCDDEFLFNIAKNVKFQGDDNKCEIYVNGQLFATANEDKKLISCNNEVLCQSEKSDPVGLAMAAVFILAFKISEISKTTVNKNDDNFISSVQLSDYAIAELNKRKLEEEKKKKEAGSLKTFVKKHTTLTVIFCIIFLYLLLSKMPFCN